MSPRVRKFLGRAIPIAFYTALVVFLGIYIAGIDWSVFRNLKLNWGFLAIATVLSLSFRYWGVMIWFFILRRLGATGLRGQYVPLTYIYAKSWLGRYIPGAATWILGKVYFASRHGVSRARLGVSGLLEGALQIVATMAFALVLLLADPRSAALGGGFTIVLILAFALCVVALIPPVFSRLVNLALRIVRRPPLSKDVMPDTATLIWSVLLYLVGAMIAGVSYYFIAVALYPGIAAGDIFFVVGSVSLASAVSMLTVFAPGGLGVREGILGLLLAVVAPGEIALAIVVVTRVWSIAVDGIFYLATAGTNLIVGGRPGRPATEEPTAPVP